MLTSFSGIKRKCKIQRLLGEDGDVCLHVLMYYSFVLHSYIFFSFTFYALGAYVYILKVGTKEIFYAAGVLQNMVRQAPHYVNLNFCNLNLYNDLPKFENYWQIIKIKIRLLHNCLKHRSCRYED